MENKKTAFTESVAFIASILSKMDGIGHCRSKVFMDCFRLFLSIPYRINFLQMGRYGLFSEKTYRTFFSGKFDFLGFNTRLVDAVCGGDRFIALDPSYLPKSGKKTHWLGRFWSGVAGEVKKGLEVTGLALVDVGQGAAYHLEAVQTPCAASLEKEGKTLVGHYLDVVTARADKLKQLAGYLVADAYFAKKDFVDGVLNVGLHLICRLRRDAAMMYPFTGERKKGRGRPKVYDGKVDRGKIDMRHFTLLTDMPEYRLHGAVLYSKGLKRKVKVAFVQLKKKDGAIGGRRIFFSTDLDMDGQAIFERYRLRFQIEFLFRDAKQHTGLAHCQALSGNKLYMHVNLALTAVSVARAVHWAKLPNRENTPFSMKDIKVLYFNMLLADRFFTMFEIDHQNTKNHAAVEEFYAWGARAA